jgi:hypothetical protein
VRIPCRVLAAVGAITLLAAAGRLSAEDPLSFKLSGELSAEAVANAENSSSVFHPVAPVPEVSADGRVDGRLVFSKAYTTLGLLDFTFQDSAVLSHVNGATLETPLFTVNELYADLNFGDLFFLRMGKQRLKWGAGFVYNPSDPVNPPKDPTAVRAEREGVPAMKAELITPVVSLAVFGVAFDTLEDTGVGSRLSTSTIPGTDLSLSGYWSRSESWTAALNASVAPLYALPGWDTLQLWFEGGLSDKARYAGFDASQPGTPATAPGMQYSFLLGGTATLPVVRTVFVGEYYHLSEGLGSQQLGAVYSGLGSSPAFAGWRTELARRPARQGADYVFLSLTQSSLTDDGNPVFDHLGFSTSCLLNLADMSLLMRHGISTTFVQDSAVDLLVTWAAGKADSEFGNLLSAASVELQVKVYY